MIDLAHGFQYTTEKQVLAYIPDIIGQLAQAIQVSNTNSWEESSNKSVVFN